MLLNKDRARDVMQDLSLDALVATSPDNVMYSSDYECLTHWINKGSQVFAFLTPGGGTEATLIAPMLEVESITASKVWIEDVVLVGEFARSYRSADALDRVGSETQRLITSSDRSPSAVAALVARLKDRGLGSAKIGLDESGLTPAVWTAIVSSLPDATIVPANTTWWKIRMIKSDEEIRRLRRSAQITEQSINAALSLVRPGANDLDVITRFHTELANRGGRPAFTCFGSGPRSAYPHIPEGGRTIGQGEVVRYDAGCTYQHYYSDLARTFVLGKPTSFQAKTWAAIVQGEEDAIDLVRPGAEPADIFRAVMKPGLDAGLEGYARVHCGHGVGITVYDPPLIMEADPSSSVYLMPVTDDGLQENMVINIETGYYIQGVGGFQCEDTMLVTRDGAELLSAFPKELELERSLESFSHVDAAEAG